MHAPCVTQMKHRCGCGLLHLLRLYGHSPSAIIQAHTLSEAWHTAAHTPPADQVAARTAGRPPGELLVMRVHDADAPAAAVQVDDEVVVLPGARGVLVHVRAHAPLAAGAARYELHLCGAVACRPSVMGCGTPLSCTPRPARPPAKGTRHRWHYWLVAAKQSAGCN